MDGRAAEGFGLFPQPKKHLSTAVFKHDFVGPETTSDEALEPHEEDLTHGWPYTNADVKQRRCLSRHENGT